MRDTDVLTFFSITRWVDAPTPELGERICGRVDIEPSLATLLGPTDLSDMLRGKARQAATHLIAERLGHEPPADAQIEVQLRDVDDEGRPIAFLCTLLPEPQAQQEPLDA